MTSADAVGSSDSEDSAIDVVEIGNVVVGARGPGLYTPMSWVVITYKIKKPMWRSLAHISIIMFCDKSHKTNQSIRSVPKK
jgi:hypothetical protein